MPGGRSGEVAGGRDYKVKKETFGDDGYVHSLECGDGFLGTCICLKLLTL